VQILIIAAAVTTAADVVSGQSADACAYGGTTEASGGNAADGGTTEGTDDGAIAGTGSVGAGCQ